MVRQALKSPDAGARLSFWLVAALLVILWLAGGSSRGDVAGQPIVRFFSWSFLATFVLFSPGFDWRGVKPLIVIASLSIFLVAFQLVPLPPAVWTILPGRELLTRAAEVSGQVQPWRPLSLSPSATVNSLNSLIVPGLVLVLSAHLTNDQHWRIVELLLALIFAGCLVALLQFSGAHYANPLINYGAGTISGNFSNRNHFALFAAFGCFIAPLWGLRRYRSSNWKAIAGIALLPFFVLILLATGSRAGFALGMVAVAAALFVMWPRLLQVMRSWPRLWAYGVLGGVLAVLISLVAMAFTLDRAVALNRTFEMPLADDLRSQVLPYVVEAILRYFPVGAGFGTFDPVFRIVEPDSLLQPLYFNHAHDDWLELLLEGGIAAVALAVGAVLWAVYAATKVPWRNDEESALARLGVGALLLVAVASFFDYPARTPLWMAILVFAAVWLHSASRSSAGRSADARHPHFT